METAWLEGSDADVSNLIDVGLREPQRFAWALVRRVADERARLLLAVQRALLGTTSPSLYGVCAGLNSTGLDSTTIVLTFYIGPEATDDELDDLRAVGAEVVADFTENFRVEDNVNVVLNADQPLPTAGEWVYLRRGFKTVEG